MTRVGIKDTASTSMLVSSMLLHLSAIVCVILFSGSLMKNKKIDPETVTHIKLVDSAPGPSALDQIVTAPTSESRIPTEEEFMEAPVLSDITDQKRETLNPKAIAQPEIIKANKRKRTAKKLETPEKSETKPKPPKTKAEAKKKEDPKDFLEKRLAAIRKDIQDKKSGADKGAKENKLSGRQGDVGNSDEVLNRWIGGLKRRINSHWSILGDTSNNISTVLSVQLDDNGILKKAVVDESSGDRSFDLSAMRAVMLASPFPPMPNEVKEKIRGSGGLALKFTPKGLQ